MALLCREAQQIEQQTALSESPAEVAPVVDSGNLELAEKENTLDSNKVGVSVLAGSIPVSDAPGFIPAAVEETDPRKFTGRIGVDRDCSAGSPPVEQQRGKKKHRPGKKRPRFRETLPRFTIVEPTLVNVEFR